MKTPKPFKHAASGRWCIQLPTKMSPTGKRQMLYFESEKAAKEDIKARFGELVEHGRSGVSATERQMIVFARQQLGGDLSLLPEVIAHWKATGAGAVQATTVEAAVKAFQGHQLPQVRERTQSDIKHRLKKFTAAFAGREMHSIHAGEVEKWLHAYPNAWTRRSYWKRIAPLFDYAVRHRIIAESPLELLETPRTKRLPSKVYTPEQFVKMLEWSQKHSWNVMRPFLALSGLCFVRTAELVRLYENEKVLCWEHILWKRKLIHVPADVAKETRRENDERFITFPSVFDRIVFPSGDSNRAGMIVPIMHHDFSKLWKKMHEDLGFPAIKNGMRKSAISYTLAARPEVGIVQAAKWAGNSETTIKKHYEVRITKEEGEKWFNLPMLF
jgi:hypothetical protein